MECSPYALGERGLQSQRSEIRPQLHTPFLHHRSDEPVPVVDTLHTSDDHLVDGHLGHRRLVQLGKYGMRARVSHQVAQEAHLVIGARIGTWLPGMKRPCLAGLASKTQTRSAGVAAQ